MRVYGPAGAAPRVDTERLDRTAAGKLPGSADSAAHDVSGNGCGTETQRLAAFDLGDCSYFVVPIDDAVKNGPGFGGTVVGEFHSGERAFAIVLSEDLTPSPGSGGQDALAVLTKREVQIVSLVAQGWVNKEIAAKLRISEWTVATHMRRIFAKLNVSNRAAMVSRCSGALR